MEKPKFKITKKDGMFVLTQIGTQTRTIHPTLTNTMKAIKIITRMYDNRNVNKKLKSQDLITK